MKINGEESTKQQLLGKFKQSDIVTDPNQKMGMFTTIPVPEKRQEQFNLIVSQNTKINTEEGKKFSYSTAETAITKTLYGLI